MHEKIGELFILHAKQLPWLPYYRFNAIVTTTCSVIMYYKMLLYYCTAKKLEGSIFEDFTIFLNCKILLNIQKVRDGVLPQFNNNLSDFQGGAHLIKTAKHCKLVFEFYSAIRNKILCDHL